MEILYLGVKSLNPLETSLKKGLIQKLPEDIMNPQTSGFVCNLEI